MRDLDEIKDLVRDAKEEMRGIEAAYRIDGSADAAIALLESYADTQEKISWAIYMLSRLSIELNDLREHECDFYHNYCIQCGKVKQ